MKTPMVSIVVPIYNVESYLDQFYMSIQAQTFNNFEVIMVDDGSTDNSLNIIKSIEQSDQRFKVFSQNNQGTGAARNMGIKYSSGEYILFLDPDDTISKDLIKDNLDLITETGAHIVVFGYDVMTDGELTNKVCFQNVIDGDITDPEIFTTYFENGAFNTLWNKMFQANMIKENKIKSPNWKYSQDRGLLLEIIKTRPKIIFNKTQKTYYQYNFKRNGSTVAGFKPTAIHSISKSVYTISEIFSNWNVALPDRLIYLMIVNGLYFDAGLYNARYLRYKERQIFVKELNNISELSIIDRVDYTNWVKTLNSKEFIKLIIAKYRLGFLFSTILRFIHAKR